MLSIASMPRGSRQTQGTEISCDKAANDECNSYPLTSSIGRACVALSVGRVSS